MATVLNNLAKVLRDTNRPAEAESLINRALDIDQNSFGPRHPIVARDLKNLGKFYKVWNRCADAEPLMQRVIDILQDTERHAGRPVPEIGPALNFQAQLLTETNQLPDAEATFRYWTGSTLFQGRMHRYPKVLGSFSCGTRSKKLSPSKLNTG